MFVLAETSIPLLKFIVHAYSPESIDSRKNRVCDDMYSVTDFISVDVIIIVPSGPFHVVLTDNGKFTSELSSAVQVKVREDPDNKGFGISE